MAKATYRSTVPNARTDIDGSDNSIFAFDGHDLGYIRYPPGKARRGS